MGSRGRVATPTKLLKLRGSRWATRGRKNEPKSVPGRPSCPTWMDAEAKAEWRRVIKSLETMGILAVTDRAVLAGMCVEWSLYVKLVREVAGLDVMEDVKLFRQLSSIRNAAFLNYSRACAQFGLTPSSRSRVNAGDKKKESPGDSLRAFAARGVG